MERGIIKPDTMNHYGAYFSAPKKTFFIDLNETKYGFYLKVTCRKPDETDTIIIPANKIKEFSDHIKEISEMIENYMANFECCICGGKFKDEELFTARNGKRT